MFDNLGQAFVALLVAGGAVLWYLYGRPRVPGKPEDSSHYGSHGTARFARPDELRKYLTATGPGFVFGKVADRRRLWLMQMNALLLPADPTLPYNQNVTVFGSSGTRKTRAVVQPNILQAAQYVDESPQSLIVIDPKGENYARSAALLRHRGLNVRLLNLLHPDRSDCWNCMDAVTDVTEAVDLAVNLVANTINPNRPRTGDPFWDNAEQAFISALVLYVKRHRPPAEQHMASVLELGTDLSPEALDAVFLAIPREDPARRFYRTFLRAEEKIRAGVVAGLGSRLQLWNSPEIASLTATSTFSIASFGTTPSALFLVIPDSKATFAPFLALFWQQAFQTLYQAADEQSGRLKVPVRCLMDEIANCGYIPDYEMKKSTMRSRGISTVEIWQNVTQLENRYRSWEELMANSDHLLFLGANELKTAELISKRLGQTTIRMHGTSSSQGSNSGSSGRSESYTGRSLMTPDEVLRLPAGEAILIPRGTYPARILKADFEAHALAREIQLADHKDYAAPDRPPLDITDVAQLWSATQKRAPLPEQAPGVPEATVDPLDFLDSEHRPQKAKQEEDSREG